MKLEKSSLTYNIWFKYEEPEPNTFGSNNISYEIYYEDGIMSVWKIGAFGDRTLINKFNDRRQRDITLKEMLENIEEISNMTLDEFRKIIGERLC